MKKVLWLLAVVAAFTLTSVAQTYGGSSSKSGQSATSADTTKKKEKKSAAAEDKGGAMAADKKEGKAKKESTLTGCISAQPNAEGMYTLSNGRYKKGVEIGPADKVKDHAGHQARLTGEWGSAMAAGEKKEMDGKEKGMKHFTVAGVKHISDKCEMAPGGGTTGMTKKGEKDMKKADEKKGAAAPK